MELIINGDKTKLDAAFLSDVIAHFQLENKMIVIEADGVVIPRDQWATHSVTEGMKIELVHFVGGG